MFGPGDEEEVVEATEESEAFEADGGAEAMEGSSDENVENDSDEGPEDIDTAATDVAAVEYEDF